MKNVCYCMLVICFFSSCLEKFDPSKLDQTHWVLTELSGQVLPTSSTATLNFSDDLKFSGKSFCNTYGGVTDIEIDVNLEKIKLRDIFITKKFCQDTDQAERAFLKALQEVDQVRMDGNKLVLFKGERKEMVFTLTKAE